MILHVDKCTRIGVQLYSHMSTDALRQANYMRTLL